MKYRMLDLLSCPCGSDLQSVAFVEEEAASSSRGDLDEQQSVQLGSSESYQREIVEGLLFCKCGGIYPIIGKVPHVVDNAMSTHSEFFSRHQQRVEEIALEMSEERKREVTKILEEYNRIQTSFSEEWAFFDYDGDNTWGWNQDQRKQIFLDDFGFTASDVREKLLLDAGCGNGALTATVSRFGMEVVGMDLSDSVSAAEKNKDQFARNHLHSVHYVQGNLFDPPLKKGSFDLIYSSGVLHHTPNTKESFLKIVPLLKKGGRMYIWVYGIRGLPVKLWMGHGRVIRDLVPMKWLFRYCRLISPIYKISTEMIAGLKIAGFRKRSTREITLDLFDCFSPPFNHTHTEEEVKRWFQEAGFVNVTVSGRQKHGFGVYGDMA